MSRPTRSTLRQGQTLYVLIPCTLTTSGRHEVRPVHLDSNAQRDRIGGQLGPRGVFSYSRRKVESVAEGLNARLAADRAKGLPAAFQRTAFPRQRAARSLAHAS